MIPKQISFATFSCLLALHSSLAEISEQFIMSASSGTTIGTAGAVAGAQSRGWASTWQTALGEARFFDDDLQLEGMASAGGSLRLRGEKKEKIFGKGIVMRQINQNYAGDVYGQFRFNSGKLRKDSIAGLLIGLPGQQPPTPKTAFFSICPKRWGSPLGMMSAGKKVSKVTQGVECEPFDTYLVLWKLENLPKVGERSKIGLKMWVLNRFQAAHFAATNFSEASLLRATAGTANDQVTQLTSMTIPNSKRTIARGMVVALYGFSAPKLHFDEIYLSKDGFNTGD
jgi:hypothetical protein